MKYEFFENLSPAESREFLEQFLKFESRNILSLLEKCISDGVICDYSLMSITPLIQWSARKLKPVTTSPDDSVPGWIRATESYKRNLFEFDEPTRFLNLRIAFYFGETFVRYFPDLKWAVGNTESAQRNMPVISGFSFDLEMAPILIVENLFRRLIVQPEGLREIDTAIAYWIGKADDI